MRSGGTSLVREERPLAKSRAGFVPFVNGAFFSLRHNDIDQRWTVEGTSVNLYLV